MKRLLIIISVLIVIIFIAYYFVKQDYRTIFTYWETADKLERPINEKALEDVAENDSVIIYTAAKYEISPISIAGIIVTESSMHTGPVNYFEEYYVRENFLTKSVEYLEDLADATEQSIANRRLKGESEHEFSYRMKKGLIWSIGICQMSIIRARTLENDLYILEAREKRNIKEIIQALLDPKESINYCGFELCMIRNTFEQETGIDISSRPEILATLYNTGNIEKILEEYQTQANKTPEPNDFGKYIVKHEKLLLEVLKNSPNYSEDNTVK